MDYGKEYKCSRTQQNMPMRGMYGNAPHRGMERQYSEPRHIPEPRMEQNSCPCECVTGDMATRLSGWPLAMVYSPNQDWEELYEPETALCQGTLFKQLYFEWAPKTCGNIKCR